MPIKILEHQRRFAEQGRIRLGHKGDKGQPVKLQCFRFTSPSEQIVTDLAALYGGTPQPWDNHGKPEFEVYSTTKSIPVIVVKGGLSQWMEYWSGGGCVHRCDGEINVLTGERCDLEEKVKVRVRGNDVWLNPHTEAKPTTRASVMLPELASIGVLRLETHGWNAAAEIPAVAELAQFVGDLVPATLELQERRKVKDGQTSRFVVPVLDLKISTTRLRELVEAKVNGNVLESSAGGGRPALQAATSSAGDDEAPAEDAYAPPMRLVAEAVDVDRLQWVWAKALEVGLVGDGSTDTPRRSEFIAAWEAKRRELGGGPAPAAEPDAEGAFPIETVEADADTVWQQILAVAGEKGMKTPDLEDDFSQKMGGLLAGDASAAELQHYLGLLQAEAAA